MLGAAPRTFLCASALAVAAATQLLLPVDSSAASTPRRAWAIQIDSKLPIQPATLAHIATGGINAVVTSRSGWTLAGHKRLIGLTRQARLRLIEPSLHPTAAGLHAACRQPATVPDTCAVRAATVASARTWLRAGTVRYVVLSVATPQAFSALHIASTTRTRLIGVVGLPAALPTDGTWETAIATAAGMGPDLAVSVHGSLTSPVLAAYLQKLEKATASAPQPPAPPDVTAPSAPQNLVFLANGVDFFTVGWTPSTDDVGVTGYQYFVDGVPAGTTTATVATVSKLVCGTYFTAGVEAYDAAGNHSPRSTIQVSTQYGCFIPGGGGGGGGSPPPLVAPTGLAQTAATASGATITWSPSPDLVAGYGVYVGGVRVDTTTLTSYTFSGWSCGSTHTVGVDTYGDAGNRSATASLIVTTAACADTTPPTAPASLTQVSATATSVTAGWTASTDDVGVLGYRVFVDGSLAGTTASTAYTVTALTCGTSHQVAVDAYDAAGNRSAQATTTMSATACAPPPGDTQAPTAPTGLAVSSATATSLPLRWTASTDNVGVTGYRVYVNGTLAGTTTTASYTVSSLTCGMSYSLAVEAFDAAGNVSTRATLSSSTAACADTQAPTAPTGLTVSSSTQTSLAVRWTASTDNVGVTGYRVYANGTLVGSPTAVSYTVSSLVCGTSYSLAVEAFDAAGNVSTRATLTAATAACSGGGGPTTHVCSGRSFYVDYGAGSDANAGTSQAAPWKRAPGMAGFAGTYAHQAHDCFYFKGGVTWPNAVFPLTAPGGGDALDNTYYGPDMTWYSGSSWSRPVFDAGGAEMGGGTRDKFIDLDSADYTTVDNIEFTGFKAVNQSYGTCAMISLVGPTHVLVDHVYVHNFSIDQPSDTNCMAVQAATYGSFGGQSAVQNSVFAGDGSSFGEAIRCVSTVRNTVIHDMIGMIFPCGQGELSGNTLYNCGYPSFPAGASGTHGDAIQPTSGNGPLYIHDNVVHDTGSDSNGNECEAMLVGNSGETDYVWNNVVYNIHGNSVALTQASSPGIGAYVWNNTITGGQDGTGYCVRNGHSSTWQTIVIENNHCITTAGRTDDPGLSATTKTVDHNVTQTPAQAAAQGYSPSSSFAYAPTTGSTATIGTGADLTTRCSGAVAGLCSSTSYGGGLTPVARPNGAAWDVGAYQTAASGTPPTNSYYVDPAATGTSTGTSWANAWKTFGAVNWAALHAGDTLYVSGGTYTAPSFTVGASGITIRPGADVGHDGTVIFDYASLGSSATATGISLGSQDNVTIEGDGRWQLVNLYNTGSATGSVGIAGGSANTGITVDHMTFVNDNNPVRFTSTSGITISNNSFQQVRGDAAIAMAGSAGGLDSSFVFGNSIERECQPSGAVPTSVCSGPDGVQVGSGVSIHDNDFKEITTTAVTSSQHPDAIQAQGDNLRIYANTFTNVGDSDVDFDTFADGTPHDVYVYDNVFRITDPIDAYPEYFRLYRSSGVALQSITNFRILNNTFVDETGSYRAVRFDTFGGSPTGSGNQIENNIFYNVGDGTASGPAIFVDPSSASWAIDYNVYYRPSGTAYVSFGGTSYTAANWVSSHEPHGKVAAPTFAGANDYHLSAGDTVARDAGASFSSLFTTDKDGTARPQGAAWDIGAYEG